MKIDVCFGQSFIEPQAEDPCTKVSILLKLLMLYYYIYGSFYNTNDSFVGVLKIRTCVFIGSQMEILC